MILTEDRLLGETMMRMVPQCSSPQPSVTSSIDSVSSEDFDFDLDLLPADCQVPFLELPLPDFTFIDEDNNNNSNNCFNSFDSYKNVKSGYHRQVPSPTNTLSPLEVHVHSPTMFSPVDQQQQQQQKSSLKQEAINRYAQIHSPLSSASSYTPVCRQSRLSSDQNVATISSNHALRESLNEFNELQSKIKFEQECSPPPYSSSSMVSATTARTSASSSVTTDATLQVKIEPLEPAAPVNKYVMKPFEFGVAAAGYTVNPGLQSGGNVSLKREDPPEYEEAVKDKLANQQQQQQLQQLQQQQKQQEDEDKMLDPVLSLAMKQVSSDIAQTCQILNIQSDPSLWNGSDIDKWLKWTMQQYSIVASERSITIQQFANLQGQRFAQLTEQDFRQHFGQEGELIHAQLDIWRSASGFQQQQQQRQPEPTETGKSGQEVRAEIQHNQQQQQHKPVQKEDSFDISYVLQMLDNSKDDPQQSSSVPQQEIIHSPYSDVQSPQSVPVTVSHHHTLSPPPPYPSYEQQQQQQQQSVSEPNSQPGSFDAMDEEMEEDEETPTQHKAPTQSTSLPKPPHTSGRTSSNIHLWQFVKELLNQPHLYSGCIHWIDQEKGIFKIVDSTRVATLWGKRKNRPAMNYDKLSRSLRQYYRKGIMKKTERTQRLVYQFCNPYHL